MVPPCWACSTDHSTPEAWVWASPSAPPAALEPVDSEPLRLGSFVRHCREGGELAAD